MSSLLYRLGRGAARNRMRVLVAWAVTLGLVGVGALLLMRPLDDSFSIPGSESQQALDQLEHVFPDAVSPTAQLVLVAPEGDSVDSPAAAAAIATAVRRAQALAGVAEVASPFDDSVPGGMISADRRAALIVVTLATESGATESGATASGDGAEVGGDQGGGDQGGGDQGGGDQGGGDQAIRDGLTVIAADLQRDAGDGMRAYAGGGIYSSQLPSLGLVEAAGVLIALVILLMVLRSVVAALMPMLIAIIGTGVVVGIVFLATAVTTVSTVAPMMAVMLSLAVCIDYSLFIFARHRDQLAEGMAVEESIARATATSGSAVVFAGITVVIAALGLSLVGVPILTALGASAAVAIVVAVAIALTLVPALLSFVGERLRPRSHHQRNHGRERVARWWVGVATRRPVLTVVLVTGVLLVCAIPAFTLHLALPDAGRDQPGSASRVTYDVLAEHFGPGINSPLVVTADIIASDDPLRTVDDLAAEIRTLPGVASVPVAVPDPGADTAVIQVIPTGASDAPQTAQLVRTLRGLHQHFLDTYGTRTAVTGEAAIDIDASAQLGAAVLPFGLVVVGLSMMLLAMVFRSIWVPVKAALGHLLAVGAALGATTYFFSRGHSMVSFLPIILMGVLFGLAMDYEVFLVSRIRETYVHAREAGACVAADDDCARAAILPGFLATSKVVTAAALIMIAVFASFVPHGSTVVTPFAFGLAAGVFIDAFVVRMTLVPAVLQLLGRRAWWFPAWLDRVVPTCDIEGTTLLRELSLADWPGPGRDEVVSARDLHLRDERGRPVYAGLRLTLDRGEVAVLRGGGDVARSALLLTLAGRIRGVAGDLKVLGHVLPQRSYALRRQVAVVACRPGVDPGAQVAAAIADEVELVLIDQADLLTSPEHRRALRHVLADRRTPSGRWVAVVLACGEPAQVADLLPSTARLISLTPELIEV